MPVSSQWLANPSTGYTINNSCVFDAASSAYMTKASTTPTLDTKFTFSTWLKRGQTDATSSSDHFGIFGHRQDADAANKNLQLAFFDDQLYCAFIDGGSVSFIKYSAALYRDVAAWYHIVFIGDSTDGTAADRVKLYVNGTRVTAFTGDNVNPAEDETFLSTSCTIDVGRFTATDGSSHFYFDGYMADVYYIDGTAYAASDFGETNDEGVWIPKAAGVSYGTTGFKLNYATSGDLGDDKSGQGNDWAEANIAASDQSKDTPTNNQITFNRLHNQRSGADALTQGNTVYNGPGTRTQISLTANIPPTGKWAVAFSASVISTTAGWDIGITKGNNGDFVDAVGSNEDVGTGDGLNMSPSSSDLELYDYLNSSSIDPSVPITTSDEFWMAVDMANGKCHLGIYDDSADAMIWVAADAGVDGDPENGTNPSVTISDMIGSVEYVFAVAGSKGNANITLLKSTDIDGTTPVGFTYFENISDFPEPTITDPSKYYQTALWTGNGSTQTITFGGNSDMQPDLIWAKCRSAGDAHVIQEVNTGVGTAHFLTRTDSDAVTDAVTAFNSDGFALGDGSELANGTINTSTRTYASWNWKANGSGSSNTTGTINTTKTSVDTTSGFGISTYTGNGSDQATYGHGLGVQPSMIWTFSLTSADHRTSSAWRSGVTLFSEQVGIDSVGDAFSASNAGSGKVEGGSSTVFTLGTDPAVNGSGVTYMSMYFAEVAGFSRFSSYTGNANADGPFIYCGFAPELLILKANRADEEWIMFDRARDPGNPAVNYLYPSAPDAEATAAARQVDLLSNGFKLRGTDSNVNRNDVELIYAAFAGNPFGGSGVSPATAR